MPPTSSCSGTRSSELKVTYGYIASLRSGDNLSWNPREESFMTKASTGAVAAAVVIGLVSCHGTAPTYSVSGSVTGSSGAIVVKMNGGNDIFMSGNGDFKFTGKLLTGDTFNVQVVDVNDECTVSGGAGSIDQSDITGVTISCAPQSLQGATIRMASLSGARESPAVTTNATGVGGIILAPASTTISGGITLSGLTPVANQIHIHQAPSGNPTGSGPAIITLFLAADGLTAVVPPGTALSASQVVSLRAGELYFNVGTAANPNGEIRGAIELQGGVAASVAILDESQVAPPSQSNALGGGTLLADLATGKVLVSYITHSVANATAAAIHASTGAGTNGASIVPFGKLQANIDGAGTNLATPLAGTRLSAQTLSDFAASLLYFEVDSPANPNGDIRGNISPL
jgi:CHRD domain-containing protein